jgi:hypothetical protein
MAEKIHGYPRSLGQRQRQAFGLPGPGPLIEEVLRERNALGMWLLWFFPTATVGAIMGT